VADLLGSEQYTSLPQSHRLNEAVAVRLTVQLEARRSEAAFCLPREGVLPTLSPIASTLDRIGRKSRASEVACFLPQPGASREAERRRHDGAPTGLNRPGQRPSLAHALTPAEAAVETLMMPAARLQSVVQHIRGEFLESPGLRLTPWQIQRLWNLDVDDCSAAVQKLLDARFLREDRDGTFVRTS
jgi:hypothetical protein